MIKQGIETRPVRPEFFFLQVGLRNATLVLIQLFPLQRAEIGTFFFKEGGNGKAKCSFEPPPLLFFSYFAELFSL